MTQFTLAASTAAPEPPASPRLAHDIRNILAGVLLHLETLERLAGPDGDKAASAAFELIFKGSSLCTDILHEAARPDRPVRRSGFDIVATLHQIIDLLGPIAPKGFVMRVRANGPHMAYGNPQEVFRILYNLAHNAISVARRTGRMHRLEFVLERRAATIAVRIADDGPGIPHEVRERLFTGHAGRFSTKLNGYGLAIARELAERNGGTLELVHARSGTSFVLELSALAVVKTRAHLSRGDRNFKFAGRGAAPPRLKNAC
jgi:signal transduction histidine kinase